MQGKGQNIVKKKKESKGLFGVTNREIIKATAGEEDIKRHYFFKLCPGEEGL